MSNFNIIDFIKSNNNYFEDYITRSTHHSNKLEGSTLSYAETYSIIFNKNDMKINTLPREIYEAINHKYALDYSFKCTASLNELDIIEIAKLINKNINEIDGYRKTQVYIKGAEHIPPAANLIKQQMMYLVHNYHNTAYDNIFDKIADFHIKFERIHPFSDGNGRTGRIIINNELLKENIAPAIITLDNKAEYIRCIENQDFKSLSKLLECLSEQEIERIKLFI